MEEVAPLGQSILYVLILQIGYASGVFDLNRSLSMKGIKPQGNLWRQKKPSTKPTLGASSCEFL